MVKKWTTIALAVALVASVFTACEIGTLADQQASSGAPHAAYSTRDVVPAEPLLNETQPDLLPTPPSADVLAPKALPPLRALADPAAVATLSPALLEAELRPGESIGENKVAFLPMDVKPPMGDILISFDLTGSMSGELAKAKANMLDIVAAVRASIPDSDFGLVSHMDYTGTYDIDPGEAVRNSIYGSASYGDYPYRLDLPISADSVAIQAAINSLVMGNGYDSPESYSRVFHEAVADPAIAWRPGAKRLMVAWLDDMPHDWDFGAVIGLEPAVSTGPDPGRDEIAGTADDLEILAVMDALGAAGITPIVLYSNATAYGYYARGLELWQAYADRAGGSAFKINADGSIPEGTPLADYIAGLITEQVKHVDEVTLAVVEGEYASWLVGPVPARYEDVTLDADRSFDFSLAIRAPMDAAAGTHVFHVGLYCDGVLYATQEVRINVVVDTPVSVDVKPGSWPNPFNVNQKGIVTVAIAGSSELDVASIDASTVRLAGVAAKRWHLGDTTSPFEPFLDKPLDSSGGSILPPDGVPDLVLQFDAVLLAAAFHDLPDGTVFRAILTGAFDDGWPLVGEDILRIIRKK
ncbi:MAG: hypothetical protein JXA15_13685 [Spirochaetales bacterium]|nr:hypothetical protein [Spirochaetales bacterium]